MTRMASETLVLMALLLPALGALGMACHQEDESEIGYGPNPPPSEGRQCRLWVTKPHLGYPATWGNGTMVALAASSRIVICSKGCSCSNSSRVARRASRVRITRASVVVLKCGR